MNSRNESQPDENPVRVLAIDKTAVLEHVRDRWDRLAAFPEIDLVLLAPELWIENFRPYRFEDDPGYRFKSVAGKTIGTGRELRAAYRSGLGEAFRLSRPQVILMFEESFSLFALQVLRARKRYAPDTRLVFYSNNVTSYGMPGYRLSRLYRAIADHVTPQCDVGLCVNNVAARVLEEAGYDVEIRTLFYGIDEGRFAPGEKEGARRDLNLPADERIILYAGRLIELKGVQDLIAAFAEVKAERPNEKLRLLIVGDGPYRQELLNRVSELDLEQYVEFRDVIPVEQMPALMSACDMLVLPSRPAFNEQFGRVNAETMLCGTTVIGSTSGAIPQVLGEGGFIFKAGDINDLKRCLDEVLDNPEEVKRRGEIAKTFALEHYSTDATVRKLRELIHELSASQQRETEESIQIDNTSGR